MDAFVSQCRGGRYIFKKLRPSGFVDSLDRSAVASANIPNSVGGEWRRGDERVVLVYEATNRDRSRKVRTFLTVGIVVW